jgi:hypothetical protein
MKENWVTYWSTVLPEKLIVTQLVIPLIKSVHVFRNMGFDFHGFQVYHAM